LMLEHLHPNARGYFLLADAYYDSLQQHGLIGVWEHPIPEDVAWEELPLTEVDLLGAQYKIEQLTSDYPYKKTKTTPNIPQPTNEIERLAYEAYYQRISWLEEMVALLNYYQDQKDIAHTLQVGLIIAETIPFNADYQSFAGQSLLAVGKPDQAIAYLKQAVALNPNDPELWIDLAKAYHLTNQDDGARAALRQALQIAPGHAVAQDLLVSLDQPTQTP
jgi:predicted Zn-dependent protease